jgi:hypothetical protein
MKNKERSTFKKVSQDFDEKTNEHVIVGDDVELHGQDLTERILPRVHPTSRCERRPAFQRCRLPARPVPAI